MKAARSKKSDGRFEFDGGAIERRKTETLPGKIHFFEDEFDGKGFLEGKVVMCDAWLLELFELTSGEIFFKSGEREIRARTNRFGVFYTPFSLTQPCFKDANGRLLGIAGSDQMPAKFMNFPFMFETNLDGPPPSCAADVEKILESVKDRQPVETSPHASLISLKAKKLIHENYRVYPSIARIAARLNVSHEHLSRQFKRDFGMTPSAYLREIRVADATFRLACGEEIIDVSHEVGYNDLSRFYKQFRQTTDASPGVCQKQLSQIFTEKK